ncbi:hypothetical protein [Flavilitoribacter nigricans]|uniref:Uncharacterized protein n=1 Tax=Flavilitoribacter nigricans (strain ATCC 23147 / DSM 23189 / NBRC 102662 / NCIMB 1420 / SS-2) TaxID=1122177 RepID=A0A2D0N6Y2_FLAN2|nr:hypothetical protein [Flavilitoribacter nigricans]PHN03533.1 hypothetical protein CRP01_26405 [Flavilitoribacter nigricans DSM 23189 = NBRC 102662]
MKQIGWWFLQLGAAFFVILLFCGNAAQPGVWNAGGGGFNLLFPEDSSAYRKIQMQREAITIQLYPGFAVVRGTYQMYNTTADSISIRVGYPVEGIYDSDQGMERNEITFDGLYRLKVLQDGRPRPVIAEPVRSPQPQAQTFDNDNWYIWESVFPPRAVTEISVYFMVNTNDAKITAGYASDAHNAFIYILESGRIWQQPIEKADFKIQLMDGLELEDIYGISRSIDFAAVPADALLFGSKKNFSPLPSDNLLINYGERVGSFDFAALVAESETYFAAVDELSSRRIAEQQLIPYEEADPYRVRQISIVQWFWMGLLIGLPALVVVLIILGRYFRRRSRR